MREARCRCGAVALTLQGEPRWVVACHCLDCQRRTGALFGVGAFFAVEAVVVSGAPKSYTRAGASGGKVRSYFCSDCGTSLYWKADVLPAMIGVAVGALADPAFPAPTRSIFEQSKHGWVQVDGAAVEHFEQGSAPRAPVAKEEI